MRKIFEIWWYDTHNTLHKYDRYDDETEHYYWAPPWYYEIGAPGCTAKLYSTNKSFHSTKSTHIQHADFAYTKWKSTQHADFTHKISVGGWTASECCTTTCGRHLCSTGGLSLSLHVQFCIKVLSDAYFPIQPRVSLTAKIQSFSKVGWSCFGIHIHAIVTPNPSLPTHETRCRASVSEGMSQRQLGLTPNVVRIGSGLFCVFKVRAI